MNRLALPVAAAAFFTVALSYGAPSALAQDAQLSIEDRHFLLHAIPSDMAEIEISRMATEKAENDQVKQYAQRMVEDHTKTRDELMRMAQEKGVQAPQELSPAHQAEMEHLRQLSGAQFDREYMGGQVIHHAMAINLYERESQQGQDEALKSFASQTLPTLKEHHDMALEITGQGLTAQQ